MPFKEINPDIFCWTDTCNVYVIKDGPAAILIDLGDGSVLDALPELGVKQVEWVLYTHHHREQCQGHAKLAGHPASGGVKVAVPANERDLFEKPLSFRALVPQLSDTARATCGRRSRRSPSTGPSTRWTRSRGVAANSGARKRPATAPAR